MEKIWKIIIFLSFFLSLISVAGTYSMYKKINYGNSTSFVPVEKIGAVPKLDFTDSSSSVPSQVGKIAYAFVGYPVSDKVEEKGGVKSLSLKGHWIYDQELKLDYINKTKEDLVVMVEIKGETPIELLQPKKQGNKKISGSEFKTADIRSPHFVIFNDAFMGGESKISATALRIYPPVTN